MESSLQIKWEPKHNSRSIVTKLKILRYYVIKNATACCYHCMIAFLHRFSNHVKLPFHNLSEEARPCNTLRNLQVSFGQSIIAKNLWIHFLECSVIIILQVVWAGIRHKTAARGTLHVRKSHTNLLSSEKQINHYVKM
jgi:hypothetical protein